jgi:hypothetical protein
VGSDGFTEVFIVGHVCCIHSYHVELDEPLPLLLGDPKVSVNTDQMGEPKLPSESIWTAEGFEVKAVR